MSADEENCARCGRRLGDDDAHVWLDVQTADLGYESIDRTHLLCEKCYEDYLQFIGNPP